MTARKALQSAWRLAWSGPVVAYLTARAQLFRTHSLQEADAPLARARALRRQRSGFEGAIA